MSRIILLAATAVALTLASQASAFTYFSVGATTGPAPGDPGPSKGQTTVINFNQDTPSGVLPASGVTTSLGDGITETVTGTVGLYTGNAYSGGAHKHQIAAVPTGDTTQYEAIGRGGSVTFDFAGYEQTHTIGSLSIYLGSIDSYNTVTFLNASGGVIETLTGSDFPSDNGDQGASITNRRVYFTFTPSEDFTSIELSSSGVAFEYDDIAVGPAQFNNVPNGSVMPLTPFPSSVPEPASWAMLLVGVGFVGGVARRHGRRLAAG